VHGNAFGCETFRKPRQVGPNRSAEPAAQREKDEVDAVGGVAVRCLGKRDEPLELVGVKKGVAVPDP